MTYLLLRIRLGCIGKQQRFDLKRGENMYHEIDLIKVL